MTVSGKGPTLESKAERVGAAVIGVLFVGVGLLILFLTHVETPWHLAAALVVMGLGLEAIVSAIRGKRSLLSRIGPLP